ncbi:hypothetical protein ACIBHX_08600 [Nonomuraea sp. NPDC050536]|uniref:hypothetical protein n=1 Tax=Nonomuraea sp. NPDC050536 TaxID=3364366 RepID=UPI0037C69120
MTTVALFAQLKLRLLAGNLRADTQRKIGFIFTLILAIGLAGLGFLLMSLLRLAPHDVAAQVVIVVYTFMLIGWIVVPLLAFGLDDTLDPARLSLFPLRTGQLAVGMFTASATGVWPLASLIVTFGGMAGLASGFGGLVLAVPAVLLQFALCLVASRLVTTALSSGLRSRRGRDVLAVAAVLVVVLAQLPNLIINRGLGDPGAMLDRLASVLRWSPSGLAAHAIADGGLAGLAELVVLAALVLLLGWLWIKALSRALVTPDASTQAASVRKESGLVDRFLPDGQLAAVVTKELKYARREPRFRVQWFMSVVVTAILAFSLSNGAGGQLGGVVVLFPAFAALMIGLQAGNSYGFDGRSFWMNAVAFGSERQVRTDLAGRHLATAVIGLPLLALVSAVVCALVGDPGMFLPAMLTAWGELGIGLGVASLISVLIPYTVPERLNAFSGAAPGQGGQAFAASLGGLFSIVLVSLPVVIPTMIGLAWVAVLAPFYGLALEIAGRRLAARIAFPKLPELLAAVSKAS